MSLYSRVVLLALVLLLVLSSQVLAEALDAFTGTLPGEQPNSYTRALPEITADGMVTLDITVSDSLVSQYCTVGFLDANEQTISYTLMLTASETLSVPLAAGNYSVYISYGLNYTGEFNAQVTYEQANGSATESETNDTQAQADEVTAESVYSGSIGYRRSSTQNDLQDWYTLEVSQDGLLTLDIVDYYTFKVPENSQNYTIISTPYQRHAAKR